MKLSVKSRLLSLVLLLWLCSGLTPLKSNGGSNYNGSSANRSIEVLPDDMVGEMSMREWQEKIYQKIKEGEIQAYESYSLDNKVDESELERQFIIEEETTYIPDPTKPEVREDSIIEHEMNHEDINSIRIADSLTLNREDLSYEAEVYAIAPVVHLPQGMGDPLKKNLYWLRWDDLKDQFENQKLIELKDYLFYWFNPNR